MAIYRFSKWRPSAILELFYHHTRPPTKSLLLAAAACQISRQSDTEAQRQFVNILLPPDKHHISDVATSRCVVLFNINLVIFTGCNLDVTISELMPMTHIPEVGAENWCGKPVP